ncbi:MULTISPECIES: hypothetical protein [Bacillus]|nr:MULTISPECIES: hypothetical protein [Bacillus]MED1575525.1 hypothetical protein [Bacillus safensis]
MIRFNVIEPFCDVHQLVVYLTEKQNVPYSTYYKAHFQYHYQII